MKKYFYFGLLLFLVFTACSQYTLNRKELSKRQDARIEQDLGTDSARKFRTPSEAAQKVIRYYKR
jgi:hypothetical protein